MLLEEITSEVCPACGSVAVAETKKNQHTNRHWNESRKFECGAVVEFSPNSMREEMSKYSMCPEHSDSILKNERRKTAYDKLVKYIGKLVLNDDEKKKLIESVKWDLTQ